MYGMDRSALSNRPDVRHSPPAVGSTQSLAARPPARVEVPCPRHEHLPPCKPADPFATARSHHAPVLPPGCWHQWEATSPVSARVAANLYRAALARRSAAERRYFHSAVSRRRRLWRVMRATCSTCFHTKSRTRPFPSVVCLSSSSGTFGHATPQAYTARRRCLCFRWCFRLRCWSVPFLRDRKGARRVNCPRLPIPTLSSPSSLANWNNNSVTPFSARTPGLGPSRRPRVHTPRGGRPSEQPASHHLDG